MKKTLMLLLVVAMLSPLAGCQRPHENEPPLVNAEPTEPVTDGAEESPQETAEQTEMQTEPVTEPQTESQTEAQTEPQTEPQDDSSAQYIPYRGYDDIYDYLHQMWEKQINQGGDVELNGQNHVMTSVLPILKKEGFEPSVLYSSSGGANVIWHFPSIGGDPLGSNDDAIVTVYPSADEYNRMVTNYCIPNEYGAACAWGDSWYLLIGNHSVVVRLPKSEEQEWQDYPPFEKVTEYFDFEIVTYSPPNDGTDEDFQYCDAIDMRAHYYDFETFLSDDKLAQILFNRETELNGGSGNNSTMNTDRTFSFPYPIVKSPDFEVNSIWIDDDGIHYTVMPYTENGHLYPFYWGKLGFWIDFIPDVSLGDGVEADYEGYNYYFYDDTHAYDESDSEFCIDFPNMGYLRVRFPYASPDDRIVTLEGLYSFFDFEVHTCTYSPTAETNPVQ